MLLNRCARACVAVAAVLPTNAFGASAATSANGLAAIPAGAVVRFHLTRSIASNRTPTGEPFSFMLLDPIAVGGTTIVSGGAAGAGTVVLSGHAGTQGHEGDVTLRIDSLRTDDGRFIAFADQRIEINGRNRKVAAALLGFVPYAGFGARFIRGSEIEVATDRPISTVLARPAPLVDAVPSAAPASPAASGPTTSPAISPQPESIPEATPTASP